MSAGTSELKAPSWASAQGELVEVFDRDENAVDVVIKAHHLYPTDPDLSESERAKRAEIAAIRSDIYKRMAHSGLTIRRRQGPDLDSKGRKVFMYIIVSATEAQLETEAERMKLHKRLLPKYREKGEPVHIDPHADPNAPVFEEEDDVFSFEPFTKETKHRFAPAEDSFFTSLERQRLLYNRLEADLADGGAAVSLDEEVTKGVFTDHTAMRHENTATAIMEWLTRPWRKVPLETIRDYFGEKIGFYFAFMRQYIQWLNVMALPSLVIFVYQLWTGEIDNVLLPIYCVLMTIWSTLFVEAWKNNETGLAFAWNTESDWYLLVEPSRPDYLRNPKSTRRVGVHTHRGFVLTDDFSHDEVKAFPKREHDRRVTYVFMATTLAMLSVACAAIAIMGFRAILRNAYAREWYGESYVGSLINVAFMRVMDVVWTYVATWLNNYEVWRTDSEWEEALLVKMGTFRFINAFTAPIYIAFIQGTEVWVFGLRYPANSELAGEPVVDQCPNRDCLRALNNYLLVVIVVMEGARNLLTFVPLILTWARAHRKGFFTSSVGQSQNLLAGDTSGGEDVEKKETEPMVAEYAKQAAAQLDQLQEEFYRPKYPGTTPEMVEMAVQFGFVTL